MNNLSRRWVLEADRLSGEPARHIGKLHDGVSVWFRNTQRGKRGIVLDLKQPAGLAALLRLAADADVLVHNMRVQAIERLGYQLLCAAPLEGASQP